MDVYMVIMVTVVVLMGGTMGLLYKVYNRVEEINKESQFIGLGDKVPKPRVRVPKDNDFKMKEPKGIEEEFPLNNIPLGDWLFGEEEQND